MKYTNISILPTIAPYSLSCKAILKIYKTDILSTIIYKDNNNSIKFSVHKNAEQKFYTFDYPTNNSFNSLLMTKQNNNEYFLIFPNLRNTEPLTDHSHKIIELIIYQINYETNNINLSLCNTIKLEQYYHYVNDGVQPNYTEPILTEVSDKKIAIITTTDSDLVTQSFQLFNSVIMWKIEKAEKNFILIREPSATNNVAYSSLFGTISSFSKDLPNKLLLDCTNTVRNTEDYILSCVVGINEPQLYNSYKYSLSFFDITTYPNNNYCHVDEIACMMPTTAIIKRNTNNDCYIDDIIILRSGKKLAIAYIEKDRQNNVFLKLLEKLDKNKQAKSFTTINLLSNQTRISFIRYYQDNNTFLVVKTDNEVITYNISSSEKTNSNSSIFGNYYLANIDKQSDNIVISPVITTTPSDDTQSSPVITTTPSDDTQSSPVLLTATSRTITNRTKKRKKAKSSTTFTPNQYYHTNFLDLTSHNSLNKYKENGSITDYSDRHNSSNNAISTVNIVLISSFSAIIAVSIIIISILYFTGYCYRWFSKKTAARFTENHELHNIAYENTSVEQEGAYDSDSSSNCSNFPLQNIVISKEDFIKLKDNILTSHI